LTTSFFKRAEGFVLVYDVTDRQSFDCIARWMGDIAEQGKQDCDVILCGNKCDMKERAVTTAEGEKLAKQYKVRTCCCQWLVQYTRPVCCAC
jgi:GTPase SAR1 family protein